MRREDYERKLSNQQLTQVIAKLEQLSGFLKDLSQVVTLFAESGKETATARRSIAQSRTALDFGEFMARLREKFPDAAEKLEAAQVIKFELGRLHLRFPDDNKRAAFSFWRHNVETLSTELYQVPMKIIIRQSSPGEYY